MRKAEIQRDTKETQVRVAVDLDGHGEARLASGIPFLDHMLDQPRLFHPAQHAIEQGPALAGHRAVGRERRVHPV